MIKITLQDVVMLEIPGGYYVQTTGAYLASRTQACSILSVPSPRKSLNAGTRFSRQVALATAAINKGVWSTGIAIDRGEIVANLIGKFSKLAEVEYANVTVNALNRLKELTVFASLPLVARTEFIDMVELIEARHE